MMGFVNYAMGTTLMILGILFTYTIIGAIIGIPMLIAGGYLIFRERNKAAQKVIRDGIVEGLKKAKEESD
jgi:hypothetical protein